MHVSGGDHELHTAVQNSGKAIKRQSQPYPWLDIGRSFLQFANSAGINPLIRADAVTRPFLGLKGCPSIRDKQTAFLVGRSRALGDHSPALGPVEVYLVDIAASYYLSMGCRSSIILHLRSSRPFHFFHGSLSSSVATDFHRHGRLHAHRSG